MGKSIVITSGKGGVGKTTCTANIGACLARRGYKVVVVDGDTGLRNLDIMLNLGDIIVYNLANVLDGKCSIHDALIQSRDVPGLYLMPAAQAITEAAIKSEAMQKLISSLTIEFDFVLIDCPAGIGKGFNYSVNGVSEVLLVVTPEIASVRDASHVVAILREKSEADINVIVNRIRPHLVAAGAMLKKHDIEEVLKAKVIGMILDDDFVIGYGNCGKLIPEMSSTGIAFSDITRRILGERVGFLKTKYTFKDKIYALKYKKTFR